jgi:aspartate racemase
MKILGIIGGIGPESTMEYYRTIIARYREQAGDGSYPQFIINSIDLKREIELVAAGDAKATAAYLLDEIGKLARAGADFGIIASNTPHIVFDEIAAAAPIPLISIVEVAVTAAKSRGWKRPALFGTRFTMNGRFYPDVFAREGITVVVPNADDAAYIHDKYMNELVNGNFAPEIRMRMLEIVDRMRASEDIDSVILAGTELPLLLRDPEYNHIPFLDTMRAHAEAAVQMMLK